MDPDLNPTTQEGQKKMVKIQGGGSDTVYGLGLFGAWVYYIGRAENFQEGVQGFLKGFIWPAILVYRLFQFLEKE